MAQQQTFMVIFKDEKGRVTIPKKILDGEGIKPGDLLEITVKKKKVE